MPTQGEEQTPSDHEVREINAGAARGALLIAVFCAGGVGEEVRTIVMPRYEHHAGPGTAALLARLLLGAWHQMGDAWRPLALVDGPSARVLLTPSILGTRVTQRVRVQRTVPWNDPLDQPRDHALAPAPQHLDERARRRDTMPERALVMLCAAGAAAERIQSLSLPWRDEYATPGHELQCVDAVVQAWSTLDPDWRFAAALDSATGRIVLTPAMVGHLQVLRADDPERPEDSARAHAAPN